MMNDSIMALLFALVKLKGETTSVKLRGDKDGVYIEACWRTAGLEYEIVQGMSHLELTHSNSDIVDVKCAEILRAAVKISPREQTNGNCYGLRDCPLGCA